MNITNNLILCFFSSSLKNHGCRNSTMTSLTGKQLLVPVLLIAVMAVASMAVVPFVAFAQTTPGEDENGDNTLTDQADNSTATTPSDNSTMTAPSDNGTATDQADNSTATTPSENGTATAPSDNATAAGPEATTITGTIKVNANQTAGDINPDILAVPEANATQIALTQVTNGTALDTQLDVVQGYLAYTVTVVDVANHNLYHVIVDPGDGSVLYASPGIPVGNSFMESSGIEMGGGSSSSGGNEEEDNG
jgi:uncharacterized membrane protein YkoI